MGEKYISKDPNQTTANEICRIAELEEELEQWKNLAQESTDSLADAEAEIKNLERRVDELKEELEDAEETAETQSERIAELEEVEDCFINGWDGSTVAKQLDELFNGDSPSDVHQFNINSEYEVKRK